MCATKQTEKGKGGYERAAARRLIHVARVH